MSIFLYKLKSFIQTLVALILVTGVLCFFWGMNVSRFSTIEGEHVFYLQSASSQGLRKEKLTLRDFPNIRGESVRFSILQQTGTQNMTEKEAEKIAETIAKEYDAVILFTEEIAGIKSYYAHTFRWHDGVMLEGRKVNLHIAIHLKNGEGAIGSPIIFDGY